jgi:hypothetical protein
MNSGAKRTKRSLMLCARKRHPSTQKFDLDNQYAIIDKVEEDDDNFVANMDKSKTKTTAILA